MVMKSWMPLLPSLPLPPHKEWVVSSPMTPSRISTTLKSFRAEKQTLDLLKLRNLEDRDNELAADDTEGKGGEEGQQRERTF